MPAHAGMVSSDIARAALARYALVLLIRIPAMHVHTVLDRLEAAGTRIRIRGMSRYS